MTQSNQNLDGDSETTTADLFEHGTPFDKSALTTSARDLLKVPDTAQDNANLSSMANFAPIYMPLLTLMAPRRLVEIGSDKGENTALLVDLTQSLGAEMHIVDPVPVPGDKIGDNDHVHFHQMKSNRFLLDAELANAYFIDGDHNHQTVLQELRLIEAARKRTDGEPPIALFIDDVGWPCGRRDWFYDTADSSIDTGPYRTDAGPVPWSSDMHPWGFASGYVAIGEDECATGRGILTAIEDFTQETPGWEYLTLPSFYGLAMLWRPASLDAASNGYLQRLRDALDIFEPILGTMEWNRVLLFINRDYNGKIWEQNQAEIRHLYISRDHNAKVWEQNQVEIQRLATLIGDADNPGLQQHCEELSETLQAAGAHQNELTSALQATEVRHQQLLQSTSLRENELTSALNELTSTLRAAGVRHQQLLQSTSLRENELTSTLSEVTSTLNKSTSALQAAEVRHQQLLQSTSWRLTAPLRWLRGSLGKST